MERTYLQHYLVIVDGAGEPVEIRRNGAAVTYKAQDLRSGEEMALEVFPPASFAADKVAALEEEARGAMEISHANLPRLRDFGREEDHLLYATEYFDGTSAENWIKTHGAMPVGPVLRIALQVISALGAAAQRGIVPGMINPRNILLVPGQTAQGDWPLIKVLGLFGPPPDFAGAHTAPGFAAQFASPEQLQNGPVTFRSEMYSLGATLSYLLTGAAPAFAGELPKRQDMPKPVLALLEEMLARDSEKRPHDPVAVEERVRTCLEQSKRREAVVGTFTPAAPIPVPAIEEAEGWSLPPWRPIAGAIMALLLVGTLAAVLLPEDLRPGRLFGSRDEPIGVPIGVTEEASNAVSPARKMASDPASQPVPAATGIRTLPNTRSPRSEVIAEARAARLSQREEPLPAPRVAERASESPASPGEGPSEEPEVRRAEPVIPRAELATRDAAASRPQSAPAAAARPKRINGLEVRAAQPVEPRAAPSPTPVRRARFLGKTPDGELVFEIPPPPPR